ncbi:hypothetical protein [Okeania sp. KiyG1]|uniref:hypothetical protein n=1 Tax=Okeania sp. KiyG1 TaxID=2720165 RepID=UPI001920463F|nr:hypothetical protein [Okeania sp. KiyG1]GGA15401.1 hypothetical protein CYANOKiyG1_29420 [Okeania sp. KiyG1]
MLEAAPLAEKVTSFIVPAIPYLLKKGGEEVFAGASRKVGADTLEWAKTIWEKLVSRSGPKSNEKEAAITEAATEVANSPSDEDAQAMLRFQIKKLLTDNPQVSSEIEKLLHQAKTSSTQTEIHIGGVHISGSTVSQTNGDIVGGDKTVGNK